MEIQLISGRFLLEDAEQLLSAIFKAKLAFHEQRILAVNTSEEDIQHSERRMQQIEKTFRDAIKKLKDSGKQQIDINATIDIDIAPRLA